jgi:hypothetical protein
MFIPPNDFLQTFSAFGVYVPRVGNKFVDIVDVLPMMLFSAYHQVPAPKYTDPGITDKQIPVN